MKERFMVFGTAFFFGCLAVMFFLHFRKVSTGEASMVKRWVQSAGEVGEIIEFQSASRFVVKFPNETITLRLNAIQTPAPSEIGGTEALAFTRGLLRDQQIRFIEFTREGGDIRGEAYNSDNQSINLALIQSGWGRYRSSDRENLTRYITAEEDAQKAGIGLWSVPGYSKASITSE